MLVLLQTWGHLPRRELWLLLVGIALTPPLCLFAPDGLVPRVDAAKEAQPARCYKVSIGEPYACGRHECANMDVEYLLEWQIRAGNSDKTWAKLIGSDNGDCGVDMENCKGVYEMDEFPCEVIPDPETKHVVWLTGILQHRVQYAKLLTIVLPIVGFVFSAVVAVGYWLFVYAHGVFGLPTVPPEAAVTSWQLHRKSPSSVSRLKALPEAWDRVPWVQELPEPFCSKLVERMVSPMYDTECLDDDDAEEVGPDLEAGSDDEDPPRERILWYDNPSVQYGSALGYVQRAAWWSVPAVLMYIFYRSPSILTAWLLLAVGCTWPLLYSGASSYMAVVFQFAAGRVPHSRPANVLYVITTVRVLALGVFPGEDERIRGEAVGAATKFRSRCWWSRREPSIHAAVQVPLSDVYKAIKADPGNGPCTVSSRETGLRLRLMKVPSRGALSTVCCGNSNRQMHLTSCLSCVYACIPGLAPGPPDTGEVSLSWLPEAAAAEAEKTLYSALYARYASQLGPVFRGGARDGQTPAPVGVASKARDAAIMAAAVEAARMRGVEFEGKAADELDHEAPRPIPRLPAPPDTSPYGDRAKFIAPMTIAPPSSYGSYDR